MPSGYVPLRDLDPGSHAIASVTGIAPKVFMRKREKFELYYLSQAHNMYDCPAQRVTASRPVSLSDHSWQAFVCIFARHIRTRSDCGHTAAAGTASLDPSTPTQPPHARAHSPARSIHPPY
jgi:hypothetical protein